MGFLAAIRDLCRGGDFWSPVVGLKNKGENKRYTGAGLEGTGTSFPKHVPIQCSI